MLLIFIFLNRFECSYLSSNFNTFFEDFGKSQKSKMADHRWALFWNNDVISTLCDAIKLCCGLRRKGNILNVPFTLEFSLTQAFGVKKRTLTCIICIYKKWDLCVFPFIAIRGSHCTHMMISADIFRHVEGVSWSGKDWRVVVIIQHGNNNLSINSSITIDNVIY